MLEKRDFRILIADDDDITREMLVEFLGREGYTVLAAADGQEAIRLMKVQDVQLVLTDYKMPGADGLEVLGSAARISPDAAVVMLTAYGSMDIILKAMGQGAYGYLTKPFNIQEIAIVADRAYERAVLISEKKELLGHLRDTYRDLELVKTVTDSRHPGVTADWLERIERLRELGVLTPHEVDTLRQRLVGSARQDETPTPVIGHGGAYGGKGHDFQRGR